MLYVSIMSVHFYASYIPFRVFDDVAQLYWFILSEIWRLKILYNTI